MLIIISITQVVIFVVFFILERLYPARQLPRADKFALWWTFLNTFAFIWFSLAFYMWVDLPDGVVSTGESIVISSLVFYFFYSFVNYWWHRMRHHVSFLWLTIHRFHHSPPRMETAVAFFKHPLEIATNSILVTFLAWFFNMEAEGVVMALAIEGALEVFHHSNIKTPKRLRSIGWIIQTPEMHLVHHQRGLHKFNYSAFLWDSIFGTRRAPDHWEGKQGFAAGNDIGKYFLMRR